MSSLNLQHQIACHECDALHDRLPLEAGESAFCSRCDARLYAENPDDLQRALAFSLAGLLFFLIMVSFPFLGIAASGVERNIGLIESITDLYRSHSMLLALVVGMVLVVFPLVKVLGLIGLLLPLQINRRLPASHVYCRLVERIAPGNMTEIYLVGVIVTFVKLASMASIIYGVAFWAFIAFVITMTAATASINYTTLWDKLERASVTRPEQKPRVAG